MTDPKTLTKGMLLRSLDGLDDGIPVTVPMAVYKIHDLHQWDGLEWWTCETVYPPDNRGERFVALLTGTLLKNSTLVPVEA